MYVYIYIYRIYIYIPVEDFENTTESQLLNLNNLRNRIWE